MPREARIHVPDTLYHIVSRGVERRLIYLSEKDRQFFLQSLKTALSRYHCSLHAYCLMGNHFHLLVSSTNPSLGLPLRDALTRYSTVFNLRHERVGHLFQGRYYSTPCLDLAYLYHLVAYIHLNPVRAGLVARPEEWSWSSHRDWAGGAAQSVDFERLAQLTDSSPAEMKESYRAYIAGRSSQDTKQPLTELIREVACIIGVHADEITKGKRGNLFASAKEMLIDRALMAGYSLAELARALNCTKAALSKARKRQS